MHAEDLNGRRVSHRYHAYAEVVKAAKWRWDTYKRVSLIVDGRGFVLGVVGGAEKDFRRVSRIVGKRNAEAYQRARGAA